MGDLGREGHGAAVVDTVRRYAGLGSPTGDPAALAALAEVLEADARAAGFETRRESTPAGDHLLWTLPAHGRSGAPLLLLTHYDTVWPLDAMSQMPIAIDGDRLSGPGVFDTKAGIALILDAARQLRRAGAEHPELRVLVTCDEEVGSPASTPLVEREARGAFAVLGFEPPHPDGALKTARRGSTRALVEVAGIESHAGLDPDAGANAIDELIGQLTRFRGWLDHLPVLANTGVISGGSRANVVAGRASAELGLRFSDAATEHLVLGRLDALVPIDPRARVSSRLLSHRPTWVEGLPGTAALAAECARIAAAAGIRLEGRPASGAADTNTTAALGIPTIDGLAPRGGGAHARHEWVSIAGIRERAALLPLLLSALGAA